MIAYRRAAAAAITAAASSRTIRERFGSCWLSVVGTTVITGAMAALNRTAPATKFGRGYWADGLMLAVAS